MGDDPEGAEPDDRRRRVGVTPFESPPVAGCRHQVDGAHGVGEHGFESPEPWVAVATAPATLT